MRVLAVLTLFFINSILGVEPHSREFQIPTTLATHENLLHTTVNNSVSVITGDFVDMQTDLVLPGPEPLLLQRSYSSSDEGQDYLYWGWQFTHPTEMKLQLSTGGTTHDKYTAVVGQHSGGKVCYQEIIAYKKSKKPFFIKLRKDKGFTNIAGEISGRTNLKNQTLEISYGKPKNQAVVKSGSGDVRYFSTEFYNGTLLENYKLDKEQKASGHQIFYEHEHERFIVQKAIAANKNGDLWYSWLQFHYKNWDLFEKEPNLHVQAHDGRSVTYTFKEHKKKNARRYYLSHVSRPDKPDEWFEYTDKYKPEHQHIALKKLPEGRFLKNEYYAYGNHTVGHFTHVNITEKDDYRIDRVMLQSAPVGTDQTPVITHRYIYNGKAEGSTDVYDAYLHRTSYHFHKDHRLWKMEKFSGTHFNVSLYNYEEYFWGEKDSQDEGNILGKVLCNSSGQVLSACFFEYDEAGNILVERKYGNFSGKGIAPIVKEGKIIPNGAECYTKKYTYSKDGFNLVLSETEDTGRTILHTYLSGTDLPQAHLFLDQNSIKSRHFYEYDANNILIAEIIDNGSSKNKDDLNHVTCRKIVRYKPRMHVPIGLPEEVEEYYLDPKTGSEQLLKKLVNTFSMEGRILAQARYDSNDAYCFTLGWEYDAHGNVLIERNALGQEIVRRYDANDNLVFEQGYDKRIYTEHTYDYSNRLIRTENVYDDGSRNSISFRYDYLGHKVAAIDRFGHETRYIYDDFGRCIQTIHPAIENEDGQLFHPTESVTYDVLSHPVTITDSRGLTTSKQYNVYGKPTKVCHPNGMQELFEYTLDGTLAKSVAPNGSYTLLKNDYLGRCILKEQFSPGGALLTCEQWQYDAFRLLAHRDAAGIITNYRYDAAGRISEVVRADQHTTYEYDARGRSHKVLEWIDAQDAKVTIQEYDDLDHIIEKRVQDIVGTVFVQMNYEYDAMGNQVAVRTGGDTVYTEYNARKEPIRKIDPLGNVTIIQYNDNHVNGHGQLVRQVEEIDPLGNCVITIYDTKQRIVSVKKRNAFDQITASQKVFYDASGNKTKGLHDVIANGEQVRTFEIKMQYDNGNQVVSLEEAVGTPEQKITRYVYNSFGQKETIIKSDGIHLTHTYDDLGRLKTLTSSDKTIAYEYGYDSLNNPIEVKDILNGTITYKIYDQNQRVKKETLANGLSVGYEYDNVGRVISIEYPNGTVQKNNYNSLFLESITKIIAGEEIYQHKYIRYDQKGIWIEAELPGKGGTVALDRDGLGRITRIDTTCFTETLRYDNVSNLTERVVTDQHGQQKNNYAYDDLYQLKAESGSVVHSYQYDSLNNRIAKDDAAYVINALNQLLDDGKGEKFAYDKNGNLKTTTGSNYTYDALDRLIVVTTSEGEYRYTYDSENRRMSKIESGSGRQTDFLYLGKNEVGAIEGGKTTQLRLLGLGRGAENGAAIALELDGITYTPLHDIQGSIKALQTLDGTLAASYQYTAFGETVGDVDDSLNNPWRFASKRWDEETHTYYFGRRYYSPETGRWLTPDPLGYADGPNLYAYVVNSPLVRLDLYGLWGFSHAPDCPTGQLINKVKSSFGSIMRLPGRAIEYTGRNWVPLPLVRDGVEITGRVLAGRGLSTYVPSYRQHSFNFLMGEGEGPDKLTLTCENGMAISAKEMKLRCMEIYMKTGIPVHCTYNASHGTIYDLMECTLQKLGVPTHSAQLLKENFESSIERMGGIDGGGKIIHLTHSQGAIITQNMTTMLTAKQRDMIQVYSLGGGSILRNEDFGGVENYISNRDWIPAIGDPVTWCQGKMGHLNNVHFLKSDKLVFDHSWDNPTYQTVLDNIYSEIITEK